MIASLTLALVGAAIGVHAQGAPAGLAPAGGSPPGCVATGNGRYEVQNVKPSASKRSLEGRAVDCSDPNALIVQLNNGVLTDAQGRIGEIVANRQFQFDGPPAQAGSIYTAGWSLCGNMSLAIGPTTVFYQCLSGNFYNIYDQPEGAECVLIHQQLLQCADSGTPSSASSAAPATTSAAVSQQTDGQPTATTPATVVSQQTDGQPTAATPTSVVTQITDGQPQATSPSNATVTSKPPVVTGGAAQFVASGAVVAMGAAAAFFL